MKNMKKIITKIAKKQAPSSKYTYLSDLQDNTQDNTQKIHEVVIIGSGPAGLTAAIYTSRAFLHPIVIEGDNPGGQLMGTTAVENWPGVTSIMGPQLMIDMKHQAKILGATFVSETVTSTDFSQKPYRIKTAKSTFQARSVIIATGASPNKLNCPGEQQYWGKGVTTCAVCDGAFYPNKRVVILGGGDTAMEHAGFMAKYTQDITIIHIKDKLTASPSMQQRVLDMPFITCIYNHTICEIKGDGTRITGLVLEEVPSGKKTEINADALFLAIGQKPNTAPFINQIECDQRGYIKLKNDAETSVSGVFCAGDVADFRYCQAIVAAGSGCMAALSAQRYLE